MLQLSDWWAISRKRLIAGLLDVILDLDLIGAGAGPRCHAPAPAGRHFLDDLRLPLRRLCVAGRTHMGI